MSLRSCEIYQIDVGVVDPAEVQHEYGIDVRVEPAEASYDAVILAVKHE